MLKERSKEYIGSSKSSIQGFFHDVQSVEVQDTL